MRPFLGHPQAVAPGDTSGIHHRPHGRQREVCGRRGGLSGPPRVPRRPRTLQLDRERLVRLLPQFGDTALGKISGDQIRLYQAARLRDGVSGRTINIEIGLVRRILKQVKLWSRLADDVEFFPESRSAGRVLSPSEKRRLFETARTKSRWLNVYCAAAIAANTGCRTIEIRHTRWQDVDLERQVLSVTVTKGRTAGLRQVPLNAAALDAFHLLRQQAARRGCLAPECYVFPARDRRTRELLPHKPQTHWRKGWRSLVEAAGVGPLRFHDLRHQVVTELIEAGVPDGVVMAIAGHRTRSMLDRYSHVRMPVMREAVDLLGRSSPRQLDLFETG